MRTSAGPTVAEGGEGARVFPRQPRVRHLFSWKNPRSLSSRAARRFIQRDTSADHSRDVLIAIF
jgi:hypothetical protein